MAPALGGSKAEVPNSREKRKEFRQCGNQHTKGGPVRAQVSCIYDMLKTLPRERQGLQRLSVKEVPRGFFDRQLYLYYGYSFDSVVCK